MPHHYGLRACTRDKFSKAYKMKGLPALARYMATYRRGDFVDIKADPSIHAGMPYQEYHGKTGVVFNVTKTSVGVEVTKVVQSRQLRKRLHVRVEHVRKSRCNEQFLKRVRENDEIKHQAKKKGEKANVKRVPPGPRPGKLVAGEVSVLEAQPYTENYF